MTQNRELVFYAVDPVSTCYDFETPLFDRVEVDLAVGRTLVIEVKANRRGIAINSPQSGTARL